MGCGALLQGIFPNPHLISPALAGRFFITNTTWECGLWLQPGQSTPFATKEVSPGSGPVFLESPTQRALLRPLTSALGVWPAPAALLRGTPLAFKQDSTGGLCSVGMGRRDRNRGREP